MGLIDLRNSQIEVAYYYTEEYNIQRGMFPTGMVRQFDTEEDAAAFIQTLREPHIDQERVSISFNTPVYNF